MKVFLLSNDDGIDAEGLKVLKEGIADLGDVFVVAPSFEMSGASHSMTLRKPVDVEKVGEREFKVFGTPADCVLLSIFDILPRRPDVVISGINRGYNMGEDVIYSGTVAAAREGVLYGIPSISVSIGGGKERFYYESALHFTRKILDLILTNDFGQVLFNLNVPNRPLREINGMKLVRLGTRVYKDPVRRIRNRLYEIGGEPLWNKEEGTDLWAVHNGYAALTPLLVDLTDYETIRKLNERSIF